MLIIQLMDFLRKTENNTKIRDFVEKKCCESSKNRSKQSLQCNIFSLENVKKRV